MPNPTGINGYGAKTYPPDETLKASLLEYTQCGLTKAQKIERLHVDHKLRIGKSMLKTIEKRLEIPSVRKRPAPEIVRQLVLDEVDKDVLMLNGPEYVRVALRTRGVMVARQHVRNIMHEHVPAGFDLRCPGRKAALTRQPLSAIGPFHEVSSDGHEKLAHQALAMGDVGLPIYAYKDKWSDTLLKISVVPNCRTNGAIGHLYLDLIGEIGGIPIQSTTDKGSEIGWQYAFQDALRDLYAPDIDPNIFPSYAILPSPHHTVIEGFWRWLKSKAGLNIKDHILRGKRDSVFNSCIPFHKDLFNWIFPPLVQAELDNFRTWWNYHQIRSQTLKEMPSGHVPIDAIAHPHLYGGMNCLIPVPAEAVQHLREYLTEEVGSRESHLDWVDEAFSTIAADVHQSIGNPRITFDNSWDIFSEMSRVMGAMAA